MTARRHALLAITLLIAAVSLPGAAAAAPVDITAEILAGRNVTA